MCCFLRWTIGDWNCQRLLWKTGQKKKKVGTTQQQQCDGASKHWAFGEKVTAGSRSSTSAGQQLSPLWEQTKPMSRSWASSTRISTVLYRSVDVDMLFMNCRFVTVVLTSLSRLWLPKQTPRKAHFALRHLEMNFAEVWLLLNSQLLPWVFDLQPRGRILLCPSWWLCRRCRLFVLYGDKLLFTLQATLEVNQPSHCRCDFVFLHLALAKWKENGEEPKIGHVAKERDLNYVFC